MRNVRAIHGGGAEEGAGTSSADASDWSVQLLLKPPPPPLTGQRMCGPPVPTAAFRSTTENTTAPTTHKKM